MKHPTPSSGSLLLAEKIEQLVKGSAKIFAWANVILILVIITQVIMRKGFSNGLIVLEELQWHLYAIAVMFGISYAQLTNQHVRVDLFHHKFSERTKSMVEIAGLICLAMPFIFTVIVHSLDFVYESWRINERSSAPSGLPYRWIIKGVIPVSFTLLFLACVAKIIREWNHLKGNLTHGS
ncbi:TRAP transporter small permease subunit [Aliivibrio kagoshimensis]|jgi:TRAP-type mannitol/chloroaromatic compound transport system permease small subunit|uniref:TRAP transporter small permease subunit n=1 Tax=Aliivibrio kagoshimensis TaxID=2910230 RepID=UPI003D10DC86